MYSLYQTLTQLLSPAVHLYLHKRKRAGKEHPERMGERTGHYTLPRPEGKIMWIHAASVGEMLSIKPFISLFTQHYADWHILLTTGTVSSAALYESKPLERCIHQFVPVDTPQVVNRFLDHWQPDMGLWMESELWPNLICLSHTRGIPLVLVNGRISKRSAAKWKKVPRLARALLSCFALVLPQSVFDSARFTQLGAPKSQYIGNLKYDAPPLPADAAALAELQGLIGDRPVFLAASTHDPEEDTLLSIHKALKRYHPQLLTIIAPRHPHRGEDVARYAAEKELSSAKRSAGDALTADTDVYIADTLGELGLFYRLSHIVFMGGSLIPHGGQNPLEPARLNNAIFSGPHVFNFTTVYDELREHKACFLSDNKTTLIETLDQYFKNAPLRQAMAKNAGRVAQSHQGVNQALLESLRPFLEGRAS